MLATFSITSHNSWNAARAKFEEHVARDVMRTYPEQPEFVEQIVSKVRQ
jgi:hypothetical protein